MSDATPNAAADDDDAKSNDHVLSAAEPSVTRPAVKVSSNDSEVGNAIDGGAENGSGSSNTTRNGGTTVPPKRKVSQHIRLVDHLQRPNRLGSHRTLSDALRAERSRAEQETLLADDELADPDGCLREEGRQPGPRQIFQPDTNTGLDIYYTIHRIRRLVLASIEDPYTMDQLKEPRMNVLIVKPLVDRLYDDADISVGTLEHRKEHVKQNTC